MDASRHITDEQMALVLELPPEDERRRHLYECPRCHSRMLQFQEFLAAEEIPGVDSAAADARLAREFDAALAPVSTMPRRRRRGTMLSLVAAAVVVTGAVLLWRPDPPSELRLRDGAETTVPARVTSQPAEAATTGGVKLSWKAFTDADGYRVELRAPSLEVVATLETKGTGLRISAEKISEYGDGVMWRVMALSGGDILSTSIPRSLRPE